jgi:integrase
VTEYRKRKNDRTASVFIAICLTGGVQSNIGQHTFRHTFGTLRKANAEDVKPLQELLRHANSRVTLDVYTQAVGSNKRAAQSKVVRMMIPGVGETGRKLALKRNGPLLDPDLLVT